MKIPCINCLTFSVCNSMISPIIDITQCGVIFKLYGRCKLMQNHLNISRGIVAVDELNVEYEELNIDYDKLEEVYNHFKQFKARNDD
jgi:hypothetical protein